MTSPTPSPQAPANGQPSRHLELTAAIAELYRGILQREPDPSGLAHYTGLVTAGTALSDVIRRLLASQEFDKLLRARRDGQGMSDDCDTRFGAVARSCQRLLGRRVSAAELELAARDDLMLGQILEILTLRRKWPADRQRKILLFGAYGNGNLGDIYQAAALSSLLGGVWKLPPSAFTASSLLHSSPYPFAGARLGHQEIVRPQVVNRHDALVIGGGGLLAHPHEPLPDPRWANAIDVPILLVGVGATAARIPEHRALLEKAVFVSARDAESLAALRSVRPDATLVRDPILCLGDLDGLLPGPGRIVGPSADLTTWVLKYPSNPVDHDFLKIVSDLILSEVPSRHRIVAMEPALDSALEQYLPRSRIEYCTGLEAFDSAIRAATRVVTMRYHGLIFALLRERPALAFSQPKIRTLINELGGRGSYLDDPKSLRQGLAGLPLFRLERSRLARLHQEFTSQLAAQSRLLGLQGEGMDAARV